MEDAEPLFVDTNVLVHANVAKAPWHEQALTALKSSHRAGHPLCGGKQIHDAKTVATMLAHDLRLLLTYNVGDYKRFAELIRVHEPGFPPSGDPVQQ